MMCLIYANVQICRYADILYIYVQICTYLINIYRYAQIYRYGPGPALAWGGGAPGWVPGCLGLGLGGPFCRHHFTRKNTIPGPGRPPGDSSFKVANYYHNILKKYYEKNDSDQVWFYKCPFGLDRMGTYKTIPGPGRFFTSSKLLYLLPCFDSSLLLCFVDVSYLVLSASRAGEGATKQGLGLGAFGGMLALGP